MNLSTSPVASDPGTTSAKSNRQDRDQEDTAQRSDAYGAGHAGTVISATGEQAARTPIICDPPCPEHLCRAWSAIGICGYQADGEGNG